MIKKTLKKLSSYKTKTTNENFPKTYLLSPKKKEEISPWTKIPLTSDNFKTINNIVEIPMFTFPKNQMDPSQKNHPIIQDTRKINKKIQKRYYQQSLLFNYGFLPQTWENNKKINKLYTNQFFGDNDPIDSCEISGEIFEIGIPFKCEVLGALGLVDQNELDWKIILVEKDFYDKIGFLNKEEAVEFFKFKIEYVRNWFFKSKTFEFKKENFFLENGRFFDAQETLDIIKSYNREYQDLLELEEYVNERKKFNIEN